jgi:transposase
MARWRQAVELAMTDEEIGRLAAIARSRSDAARRVQRAQILLTYRESPSFFGVGQRLGLHHQTVQRCVERAMAYGPLAALDDRPRPGKEPTITPEAKAWLVSLACNKAKEHGYPHELWTTRLLARHARENAPAACRKLRFGRIGDASRRPGRATQYARSAESDARRVHLCSMSGAFAKCCNNYSRKTLALHANAARSMRQHGQRTRVGACRSVSPRTNFATATPAQWACPGCPWLVIGA